MVLCIISWVASGFGLLGVVNTFFGGENGLELQISTIENSPLTGFEILDQAVEASIQLLEITLGNFQLYHVGNTLIYLIGIFSVYLMFNLKKIGFYLYLVYAVAGVWFYDMMFGELPTSFMTVILMSLMSVVFIILYSVNLKRMTE